MNDAQLEATLRATLTARAETVTRGPDWHLPSDLPAHRVRGRHAVGWLAPLAAAAAVAAVVASVVAIEHESSGRHIPPATAHPSGTPTTSSPTTSSPTTSSPTSATTPPPPTAPLACTTALPAAWTNAIQNSRLALGSMAASVDAIAADGTLVISRDFGVTPGSARDIVLVAPGQAPRVVYRVQDPDHFTAEAEVYGRWLVVDLDATDRPPPHTIPNTPPPAVRRLLVLNLDTGAQRTIIALPPPGSRHPGREPSIELTAVLRGKVYWQLRQRYTSKTGVIESYDLATGATRTEYSGPTDHYPTVTAAGIVGSVGAAAGHVYVPAPLPPAVAHGMNPQLPAYVSTDGTSWAWVENGHEYGWWTKGRSAPVYVRTRQPIDLENGPRGFVVSGHYVFTDNQLIDMTAKAAAPLTGHGLPNGKFTQFEPDVAHDGVLYGTEYAGTGHYVDGYWQDPQPQVQRVITNSGLPDLHC
jgi:hypothetical protein